MEATVDIAIVFPVQICSALGFTRRQVPRRDVEHCGLPCGAVNTEIDAMLCSYCGCIGIGNLAFCSVVLNHPQSKISVGYTLRREITVVARDVAVAVGCVQVRSGSVE